MSCGCLQHTEPSAGACSAATSLPGVCLGPVGLEQCRCRSWPQQQWLKPLLLCLSLVCAAKKPRRPCGGCIVLHTLWLGQHAVPGPLLRHASPFAPAATGTFRAHAPRLVRACMRAWTGCHRTSLPGRHEQLAAITSSAAYVQACSVLCAEALDSSGQQHRCWTTDSTGTVACSAGILEQASALQLTGTCSLWVGGYDRQRRRACTLVCKLRCCAAEVARHPLLGNTWVTW